MKINAIVLLVPFVLTGCQSEGAAPPVARAVAAPAAPVVAPSFPHVRTPEIVKTYTIGAYVDPHDPTLRHEAHTVQRIEAAAYWNLRPFAAADTASPLSPDKAPTQIASKISSPPAPKPVPVAELTVDPEPALMPNAEGVIDLAAADRPAATEEVNPFAVRATPAGPPRTIELRVTGILAGAKPCAIINGQLLEPGGTVEGLIVRHIEPGGVVLTLGQHRLRILLSAGPVRILTAP